MVQIDALNDKLSTRPRVVLTADQLDLAGAKLLSGGGHATLPADAVLVRLCWNGPPECPYIHGHFAPEHSRDDSLVVDLHTDALRELSHRLHLRQDWGLGSITSPGRS
jgi:hypothetical protein